MSPVEAIFVPFPPKTGTNMLHPLPPPIVELVGFLPISAAASDYLYRQPPSGQSRVYEVTQLRTYDVQC